MRHLGLKYENQKSSIYGEYFTPPMPHWFNEYWFSIGLEKWIDFLFNFNLYLTFPSPKKKKKAERKRLPDAYSFTF